MKKLYLIFVIIFLGIQIKVIAQDEGGVSIGKGNVDADPSAILELVSSGKGLLIPRLSQGEREGISSPARGLLVYDTDKSSFYYWSGTKWKVVGGGVSTWGIVKPSSGVTEGELFYNTEEEILYVYLSGAWEEAGTKGQILKMDGTILKLLKEGQEKGSEVDLSVLFQDLSFQGTTLSISNGNSVDLSDFKQTLSLNGTILSITNGNSVDFLTLLEDKGDMMKSTYDSNNNRIVDNAEMVNGYTVNSSVPSGAEFTDDQLLSISGNSLTISSGNTVVLPSSGSSTTSPTAPATASTGDTYYNTTDGRIYVYNGTSWETVGSGGTTPSGSTFPTAANEGDTYYNTTDNALYIYNGTSWETVGADDQTATEVAVTPNSTIGLSSSNVQSALEELQGEITTAASGGMTSVVHDTSLTGNGVIGNELGIADNGVSLAKISDGGASQVLTTDDSGNPQWQDISAIQVSTTDEKVKVGAAGTAKVLSETDFDGTTTDITIKEGAVTAAKIADGTIMSNDMKGTPATDPSSGSNTGTYVLTSTFDGGFSWTDITSGVPTDAANIALATGNILVGGNDGKASSLDAKTDGQILVGNGTTVSSVALGGDATIDNTGALTIKPLAVEEGMIASDAVTTAKISDLNVTTAKLALDAVTNAQLADDAVQTENIKEGAVTTAKIADGTIMSNDMKGTPATDPSSGSKTGTYVLTSTFDGGFSWTDITSGVPTDAANIALATGNILVGGNDGKASSLDAKTDGQILVGNGTTVSSVAMGGDATIDNTGALTIKPLAVEEGMIAGDAVTTAKIRDLNVTTAKLALDAVTNAQLAGDAVQTENIKDGEVKTDDLADANVTAKKIAGITTDGTAGQVLASKADGTFEWAEGLTGSLATGNLFVGDASGKAVALDAKADGQILVGNGTTVSSVAMGGDATIDNTGALTIKPLAVEEGMIAGDAVTTAKISDFNVTTAKLALDAVTNAQLAGDAVQTDNIKEGAVTTAKIADGTIMSNDMKGTPATDPSSGSNTGTYVLTSTFDGGFSWTDITSGVPTDAANIALATGNILVGGNDGKASSLDAKTDGQILVGNGTTVSSVAMGGDATIDNTGALTIKPLAVEEGMIAGDAVTTAKIRDLNVTTAKLALDAVTNAQLAGDAVQTENIKDGEVKTDDLADANVTAKKIAGITTDGTAGQVLASKADGTFEWAEGLTGSLATGNLFVGDASGKAVALDAKTDGQILVGNGTTVSSVAVSGDVSINGTGVTTVKKIQNVAVSSTPPDNGQVLVYDGTTNNEWVATDMALVGEGTTDGNTLRWNNISKKWEDSSALTNDGTNIATSGDLTVYGNDIAFGNGETISNTTGGTVAITATTLSASGKITADGDVVAKRYVATTPSVITPASETTVDLSGGNVFTIDVITNITTLTLNNAPLQPATFMFKLTYSSSATYTITWPSSFKWSNAEEPVLTCVAGKTDIISAFFDGTTFYCAYAPNF